MLNFLQTLLTISLPHSAPPPPPPPPVPYSYVVRSRTDKNNGKLNNLQGQTKALSKTSAPPSKRRGSIALPGRTTPPALDTRGPTEAYLYLSDFLHEFFPERGGSQKLKSLILLPFDKPIRRQAGRQLAHVETRTLNAQQQLSAQHSTAPARQGAKKGEGRGRNHPPSRTTDGLAARLFRTQNKRKKKSTKPRARGGRPF